MALDPIPVEQTEAQVIDVTGDGVGGTQQNRTITQYPAASTSTVIDWSAPKTFGTFTAPITGTLTESNTGAKPVTQVIYYQGASFTAPSADWKQLTSDDYDTVGVNKILVEYISNTQKDYTIINFV